jgi:hypothetical protein
MDEVTFEVDTQAAAAITNIGGDQTLYAPRSSTSFAGPRSFSARRGLL